MQRYRSLAAILVMAVLFTAAILVAQDASDKTTTGKAAAAKKAAKADADKKAAAVKDADTDKKADADKSAAADKKADTAKKADAGEKPADENAAPAKTEGADNAAAESKPAENAPTTENAEGGEKTETPEAAVEPAKGSMDDLWNNLLYYIKIARPDLAKSYALGIIKSTESPDKLYLATIKTLSWQATLNRGGKLEGLGSALTDVRKIIEAGYNIQRADPEQIRNTIDSLAKGVNAYELAVGRLKESGEYALPQLIQRLMDTKTSQVLRERIINVLPRIGLPAARPLSVALLSDDPEVQYVCVNSLAQIGYPLSLPNLKDLMERPNVLAKVKEAARVAIVAIDANAIGKTSAELFYDLALKYYYGRESLAPDARYETANVWYWQEGQGLSYRPVPRPVFNDIYAMRNAALTLKHDPTFYDAVSLWLAAHFKKEADMPKGAKDPTVTPTDMSAEYYALASSAKYLQDVLERGLKDQNSAVAVGAIRALDRTAGTKNLVAVLPGGVQPLVKALTYPDRNVRFMAAVTLAKSLPAETFSGVDLVAPVLNEALRQTGVKRVLLVVSDEKTRNTLKDAARAAGYDIVEEVDPGKAIGAARDSAGVDLAVLAEKPSAIDFISRLRADPVFAALPAVVMDQTQEFARFAQKDKRSVVIEKLDAPNITKALAAGLQIGTGQPLSTEDASAWAVKSADAIRTLGMTNNPVLDVARTRASLVAALGDKRPEVQIASAGALAMMIAADAQRAIAKLTVDAQAPEKVRIAAFGSLCESIKKFGNQLTDDQAQAVLDVVNDTKASRDLRNAAAAALGAMNLPSEKIKTLIPIQAGI